MIMKQIHRTMLSEFLDSCNGRIFTITFLKKNGEMRSLNCRIGVGSYRKTNGKVSYTHNPDNPYRTVFDMQKMAYRSANLNTARFLASGKVVYKVVD